MSGSFAEIHLQLTRENAQDSETHENEEALRPNVSVSVRQCVNCRGSVAQLRFLHVSVNPNVSVS